MSDKPVATITTHEAAGGELVWYLGAAVAERPRDADPGATAVGACAPSICCLVAAASSLKS